VVTQNDRRVEGKWDALANERQVAVATFPELYLGIKMWNKICEIR
jgi:hypothetical protein